MMITLELVKNHHETLWQEQYIGIDPFFQTSLPCLKSGDYFGLQGKDLKIA